MYDNILVAMIGLDYAQLAHQECVLLQLDLDKAFNKTGWLLITKMMNALGFVSPNIITMGKSLGIGSLSQLLFNGKFMGSFNICR